MSEVQDRPVWLDKAIAAHPPERLIDEEDEDAGFTNEVTSGIIRLSFVNFAKTRSINGGEPRFSASLLFPIGADMSAIEELIAEIELEEFGTSKKIKLKNPLIDQDPQYPGNEAGGKLLRVPSKRPVPLVGKDGVTPIDVDDVYPGCYGIASLHAFAYRGDTNNGVTLWIDGFQKVADFDRLGGGSKFSADRSFKATDFGADDFEGEEVSAF